MEEHAMNGEYISALRNGVLSYGDGWTAERPYRLGREEFDRCRREASASLLCTILDVRAK